MQIETIKIFCDVIRMKSFSKAAEINHVTQSTVSQGVHLLEERLGVQLIDRSKRPWELTLIGKKYYEGVKGICDDYFALEKEVMGLHGRFQSTLKVASIYSAGLRHMKNFVQKFSGLYPQIKVHLEYLHPQKVYDHVVQGEVDLGIVSFPKEEKGISVIHWREEKMVLVFHPDHRFRFMENFTLKELKDENYVHFDTDLIIRKEIDSYLRRNWIEPEIVMEFDNIEAIKRAVEIGSGVAILPRPTLDYEINSGTLCFRELPQLFVRPLGIIFKKGKVFHENLNRFVESLKKEV